MSEKDTTPKARRENVWEYVEHGPPVITSPEEATTEDRAQLVVNGVINELARRQKPAEDREKRFRREYDQAANELQVINSALKATAISVEMLPPPYIEVAEKYRQLIALEKGVLLEKIKDEPPFDLRIMSEPAVSGEVKKIGQSWPQQHAELLHQLFDSDNRKSFSRTANCLSRSAEHVPHLEDRGILSHTQIHSFGQDDAHQFVGSTRVEKPYEFFKFGIKNIHNFGRISVAATVTMAELQRLDWE